MVRIIVLALAAALAWQEAAAAAPLSPEMEEEIRTVLRVKLKDPYSARIEAADWRMRPNLAGKMVDTVCGLLNAKNSYGAYIGATRFVYFREDRTIHIATGGGNDFVDSEVVKTFCGP